MRTYLIILCAYAVFCFAGKYWHQNQPSFRDFVVVKGEYKGKTLDKIRNDIHDNPEKYGMILPGSETVTIPKTTANEPTKRPKQRKVSHQCTSSDEDEEDDEEEEDLIYQDESENEDAAAHGLDRLRSLPATVNAPAHHAPVNPVKNRQVAGENTRKRNFGTDQDFEEATALIAHTKQGPLRDPSPNVLSLQGPKRFNLQRVSDHGGRRMRTEVDAGPVQPMPKRQLNSPARDPHDLDRPTERMADIDKELKRLKDQKLRLVRMEMQLIDSQIEDLEEEKMHLSRCE